MADQTARQQAWSEAAERSRGLARMLFTLLAEPNEAERTHNHRAHIGGFSRNGRRGLKCRIDGTIIKWIDPA